MYKDKASLDELYREIERLKEQNRILERQLTDSTVTERKYLTILENVAEGYFELDFSGNFIFFNETVCEAFGYSREELLGMNNRDYCSKETAEQMYQDFSTVYSTDQPLKQREYEIITKQGSKKTVEISAHLLKDKENQPMGFNGVARDVTERKQSERALKEREKKYRLLADNIGDVVWTAVIQNDGSLLCTYISPSVRHVLGYTPEEVINYNLDFNRIFNPSSSSKMYELMKEILDGQNQATEHENFPRRIEVEYICKNGLPIWCEIIITLHKDDKGRLIGIQGVTRDIHERKTMEQQLRELNQFDSMTGLYNRAVFEHEMEKLQNSEQSPIGIIICDVDGLKWINDTLGHQAGDELLIKASDIIKSCFRKRDIVARIGGDEFAVLLPETDEEDIENVCSRIRKAVEFHNNQEPKPPLALSIGHAVNNNKTLHNLFKEADNKMYKEKLHSSQSSRSAVIETLTSTLEARDYLTEEHSNRMEELVINIGKFIGLSEDKLNNLALLAKFHDLGKLGIPDRVLFKPGPLTDEEYQVVQRHSEIGHKIALSGPKLKQVADFILKHHEWWNGQGYPFGLRGEETPLECRLLSLLDAYDAMTSDRPYRRAMTKEEALEEIKRCSGSQFDPRLAEYFIEFVNMNY